MSNMQEYIILLLRVADLKQGILTDGDNPYITHLATGLSIKRRALQNDDGLVAIFELIDARTVLQYCDYLSRRLCLLIAQEFSGWIRIETEIIIDRTELTRRARAGALRIHFHIEAIQINAQPFFTSHIGGQINRKPVGIIKFEGDRAVNDIAIEPGYRIFKNAHPLLQRFRKALLFLLQHTLDVAAVPT